MDDTPFKKLNFESISTVFVCFYKSCVFFIMFITVQNFSEQLIACNRTQWISWFWNQTIHFHKVGCHMRSFHNNHMYLYFYCVNIKIFFFQNIRKKRYLFICFICYSLTLLSNLTVSLLVFTYCKSMTSQC